MTMSTVEGRSGDVISLWCNDNLKSKHGFVSEQGGTFVLLEDQ